MIGICCDATDAFLERLLAKSSVTWEMTGFDLVFVAMPFMYFLSGEMVVGFDTLFVVMPLMRSQSFVGKASWKVGWALAFQATQGVSFRVSFRLRSGYRSGST